MALLEKRGLDDSTRLSGTPSGSPSSPRDACDRAEIARRCVRRPRVGVVEDGPRNPSEATGKPTPFRGGYLTLPGRLMEVRLGYGEVELVCEVLTEPRPPGPTIGIDLGVNTILAATDGDKAILVSGREIKATVQLRNKRLAAIVAKQAKKRKGSRRHKRLQRSKHRMLGRTKNKVRDLCYKATRKVADAFPNAQAYVGEPFNDACRKIDGVRAQTVSAACNRKIINLLSYKLAACIEVEEHYTSQTCPVCGERSKQGRTYRCRRCGYVAPRDVVGCTNIRAIGIEGGLRPGCPVPNGIQFVHPSKYPGTSQVAPGTPGKLLQAKADGSGQCAPPGPGGSIPSGRESAGLEPVRSVTGPAPQSRGRG
jgi:hypothetical protein